MAKKLIVPVSIHSRSWPKAPTDIRQDLWEKSQLFLKSKGCPDDVIAGITTIRRMNIFVIALSFPTNIYFEPSYKWVLDNENTPEINKLLIWKHALGV